MEVKDLIGNTTIRRRTCEMDKDDGSKCTNSAPYSGIKDFKVFGLCGKHWYEWIQLEKTKNLVLER